jgi:sulfite reductase alpha subunit-like flavoprotein
LAGPYSLAFALPEEKDANLLMIGLGTGVAPFRAFVKHTYSELGGWEGKVRLYHGAKQLDEALVSIVGSAEEYEQQKAMMIEEGRWAELLY